MQPTKDNPVIPAVETEAEKTRQQRATDVAYTINHAVSCATTDMLIAPTISALFGVNVGCSDPTHHHGSEPHDHFHAHHDHDHKHEHHEHHHDGDHHHAHEDHDHGHAHDHEPPVEPHAHAELHSHGPQRSKLNWQLYKSEALHYLKGEIVGDLAAVPLTIMVQRYLPSVMAGLGSIIGPLASPFFRSGAERTARRWGHEHGFADDAPEVVARAEAMYRSEMKHLPQAVMWNLFAFPIGVVGQKWGGHASSTARIIRNKSIGAVISNGILLGGRALNPDLAGRWDDFNSTHVIVPTTKVVGKLFGVKDSDMDRIAQGPHLEGRVTEPAAQPQTNLI